MVPAIDAILPVLRVFATKTSAQEQVLGVWARKLRERSPNTSSHDEEFPIEAPVDRKPEP
jgi:hypothetical protein